MQVTADAATAYVTARRNTSSPSSRSAPGPSARSSPSAAIGDVLDGRERATIGFRPETVVIGNDGPIPARIRLVEDLGSEVFVHLVIDDEGDERRIVAKVDPPFGGTPDENVRLALRGAVHFFDGTEVRRATITL